MIDSRQNGIELEENTWPDIGAFNIFLDFRLVTPFRNDDDSKATGVEKSRPNFALFTPCKN